MQRCSLKPPHWPDADRDMWTALVAEGHLLDDVGPGRHWRASTRGILMLDYGFWLSYLTVRGIDLNATSPICRVTPEHVRNYVLSMNDLAASSRACRLRSLSVIVRRVQPEKDWQWLLRARQTLDGAERLQRGVGKRARIVASHVLFQAGMRYVEAAHEDPERSLRTQSLHVRDGVIIALLAARPLRIKNFAALRLGHHVQQMPNGYRIDIPAQETKTNRPIETSVPDDLLPALALYLEQYRPVLLNGRKDDHLWITRDARPVKARSLSTYIGQLTQRLVGKRVTPHLFRDCAATTIATVDPDHVHMIASLLGHATPTTAERYYNQARTMEAGRTHQANIRHLRDALCRPIGRRS